MGRAELQMRGCEELKWSKVRNCDGMEAQGLGEEFQGAARRSHLVWPGELRYLPHTTTLAGGWRGEL